jgi:hypothetical protein
LRASGHALVKMFGFLSWPRLLRIWTWLGRRKAHRGRIQQIGYTRHVFGLGWRRLNGPCYRETVAWCSGKNFLKRIVHGRRTMRALKPMALNLTPFDRRL